MEAEPSNPGDCGGGNMDLIQTYIRTEDLRPVEAQRYCRDIALYCWNGCADVRVIREVK